MFYPYPNNRPCKLFIPTSTQPPPLNVNPSQHKHTLLNKTLSASDQITIWSTKNLRKASILRSKRILIEHFCLFDNHLYNDSANVSNKTIFLFKHKKRKKGSRLRNLCSANQTARLCSIRSWIELLKKFALFHWPQLNKKESDPSCFASKAKILSSFFS